MPGTKTDFGQMFDHELNPRKGWSGDRGMALEKTLPIKAGLDNKVFAGSVVHIRRVSGFDSFVLGVEDTASTLSIGYPPLLAFQNEDDFDVNPDLGNIAGGVVMALSCLGSFELESTEIAANATFSTGSYLTADNANNGSAANGKIKGGALTTNTIIGIVSEQGDQADGSFENDHGQNVVRFWTWFLPVEVSAA